MDVKAAVDLAKKHIADLFGQEGAANIGLEEVEYDEAQGQWRITVGFTRIWDRGGILAQFADARAVGRTYKIVTLDNEGKPLSVKNREPADAG